MSNDHVVKEGSYLEKSKNKNFGVGHTMESHTNETVWKTGNKCFIYKLYMEYMEINYSSTFLLGTRVVF